MKKTYIIPQIDATAYEAEEVMAPGSVKVDEAVNFGEAVEGTIGETADSRSNFSVWDDEE